MLAGLFRGGPAVEERAVTQASAWGSWAGDLSGTAHVSQSSAMQLLAVYGCVSYVSETISTLPVDVFTQDAAGVRKEVTAPRWLANPTVDLSFIDWCSQVLTSLLLHGNAYCVVTRSGTQIVEVFPVDPQDVSVYRPPGGRKVYLVEGRPFAGEILHIKGKMLAGSDVGLSPLECARRSISLGLEAVDYGADNFTSTLNMPGVIELPGKAQPEIMREMGLAWRKQRTGKRNRGLPGVLEGGAQWKPTGVTNEQAQFLQTRQWTAAEIAGQVFLIDPSELGIPVVGTSLTYGNMEQRAIASFRKGFLPHVIRIEQALSSLLPMPRFVKLNVDGLLRGDSAARWDVYGKAMTISVQAASIGQPPAIHTGEIRDLEDMGDMPDMPEMPDMPDMPAMDPPKPAQMKPPMAMPSKPADHAA